MAYFARPDEDLLMRRPDDSGFPGPTITASDEDPEYPATNINLENPAWPAKQTTVDGYFMAEFDEPVSPVASSIIYHYLDAALDVRLQGNDEDVWTSPGFDAAFTIPPKRLDGPSYQRWTQNPFLLIEGEPEFTFWRLLIAGTNSQAVHVGRWMLLSAIHRVDLLLGPPIAEDDTAGEIVQPTELGVETILDLGGPRRGMTFLRVGTDLSAGTAPVQQAADFRAFLQSMNGRKNPALIVPFEDNDAWLVRPESAVHARSHQQGGYQEWPLSVREVSRGLPFP